MPLDSGFINSAWADSRKFVRVSYHMPLQIWVGIPKRPYGGREKRKLFLFEEFWLKVDGWAYPKEAF